MEKIEDIAEQLKKEIDDLSKIITDKRKKLEEICNHKKCKVIHDYYSGTYFDKASTITTVKCLTCGRILEKKEVEHDWYG